MDRRVEVQLPESVADQIEQATLASGKSVDQLIVEALEFWLSNRRINVPLERQERVIAELTSEGIFREPTPDEIAGAALWDSLSPEDKDAVRQELDHLPPGESISNIVVRSRG